MGPGAQYLDDALGIPEGGGRQLGYCPTGGGQQVIVKAAVETVNRLRLDFNAWESVARCTYRTPHSN